MSKMEMGIGDVPIQIDGQNYILKPTLKAAQDLSRSDGIRRMVERCANLEEDALLKVIVAGLGRSSRDLAEKVFRTGWRNVAPACITFLSNLSNGGRPITEEDRDAPLDQGEEK